MTWKASVDATTCSAFGNCVVAAPQVFDLDPDTNTAFVLPGHPTPEDEGALIDAEADCPVRAILLSRA